MSSPFKKYGQTVIGLIGAVGIIATVWVSKGTEWNDTAWLYAFCVWLFVFSVFEVYSSMTKNKK